MPFLNARVDIPFGGEEASMYAIFGITGHVGKVAAQALLDKGKKVRGIVRSEDKGAPWRARGAEIAIGDLSNPSFATRALTGVEGAFLLLPPSIPETDFYVWQRKIVDGLVKAAVDAKVPHVVLLSSIGAQHASGVGPVQGLHYFEEKLANAKVNFTSIRAGSFMENWSMVLGPVKEQGVFPNFIDEKRPIPMVATHDIGQLVARALQNPVSGRKILDLAGPKERTVTEVVEIFSRLLNKPIQIVNIPAEQAVGALTQAGFPPVIAEVFADMYAGFNAGRLTWETKGTELIRGTTTLEDFLAKLVAA